MSKQLVFSMYRLLIFFDRHRLLVSFFAVLMTMYMCYYPFALYLDAPNDPDLQKTIHMLSAKRIEDLRTFLPSILFSLLAMVVGTLIIAVSIASTSIPKLIDLYMQDWIGLFYIWFVTLSFIHGLSLEFVGPSEVILNTYVFLPVSSLLALPYIFYVFHYTKPPNVIQKIHHENLHYIRRLRHPFMQMAMEDPKLLATFHFKLFESLNQMDDLLEYLPYKEPKSDILSKMGEALRTYVAIKPHIPLAFFTVTERIRSDISYKTMTDQFDDMARTQTFYERKVFYIFSNAYTQLLVRDEFDLAVLCASELKEAGRVAIHNSDDDLIDFVGICFNTFLRFGIKHGLKNAEPRNIYNLAFHYGEFIKILIENQRAEQLKQCCQYLKMYSIELSSHSHNVPSFAFLVTVLSAEINQILIQLCEGNWPTEFQVAILDLLLQIDRPSEGGITPQTLSGARTMHLALALYYLSVGQKEMVNYILHDMIQEYQGMARHPFIKSVESACELLRHANPKFWEYTDRGSSNIFYSPHQAYVPGLLDLFYHQLAHATSS